MTEEATFLDVGGQPVYVVFCHPNGVPQRAVVICDPLGEEKLWAHRPLVTFSRELASRGVVVVRFDFRGEGDSGLEFEESTIHTRLEDIQAVVSALRHRQPRVHDVSLVGLRFGATLAATAAAGSNHVRRLVLWDPIISGASYAQSLLRINLASQLAAYRKVVEGREALLERLSHGAAVNIEGYALTSRFYEQICSVNLAELLTGFEGGTLVLRPGVEGGALPPDLAALQTSVPGLSARLVPQEPFWKETRAFFQRADGFTSATLDWLG